MSLHSAPANASRPSNQLVTSVTVRRNSTNVRMYVCSYSSYLYVYDIS